MSERFVAAFDLDGTLVDTPRGIVRTFTATFAALGVPPPGAEAIRATIGLPLDRAFGALLGVPPGDNQVRDAIRTYQDLFRRLLLPEAEDLVFPGVREGLAALMRQGIYLAVATSKVTASAEALLGAAGLREHFRLVVCADQVRRPKPDPESGYRIMRSFGVPARRAVMVGDTTHDLLMAAAAGMPSVAVTYGVHDRDELSAAGPTLVADTFPEAAGAVLALRHAENRVRAAVTER